MNTAKKSSMSQKLGMRKSFSTVGGASASAVLLAITLSGCSLFSDTEQPTASVNVANAALVGGSPRVALQVAQNVLSKSPDDVPALLVRGDALTQLGSNQDAADAYQHALRIDPKSVRAKLGVARLSLSSDPNQAAKLFREVLTAESSNATALTDLGIALDLLGQHREAQSYYQRVLKDAPDNAAVKVNLALSLAMSGDGTNAVRLIEPLGNNQNAPVKLRHNYAAVLAMAGRRTEAAAILKADLSQDDTNRALAAYATGRTAVSSAPVELPQQPTTVAEQPPVAQPAPAPVAPPVVAAAPPPVAPAPAPAVTQPAPVRPASPPVVAAAAPAPAPTAPPPASRPAPAPVAATQPAIVPDATQAPTTVAPPPARVIAHALRPARPTPQTAPVAAPAPSAPPTPPAAAAPAVTATPTPAPPASAPAPATAAASSQFELSELGPHVQLGAFDSEASAKSEWARLQRQQPRQFADREPEITSVVKDGRTFWRLRTWGFEDQSAAKGFCSRIRAATSRCMVFSI